MKSISKISIIGAGVMGTGIAQICAQSGIGVHLYDNNSEILSQSLKKIQKGLDTFMRKGILSSETCSHSLSIIRKMSSFEDSVRDVDMVIEAVPEELDLKKSIFNRMDEMTSPETIFATNTSSISITQIATATKRANKVIGIHFFIPVPIVKGVEIIPGLETSDDTVETVMEFVKKIGKEALIAKDFPGFIVNRLLPLLVNECFYLLWQGLASAEDIDRACTLMLQHPIGPMRMADYVGLDTVLHVLEYLYRELGEKYNPCPLLKQLVYAGHYGRKTGKGVYDYGVE